MKYWPELELNSCFLIQEEGLYSLFYHNCYNSDYRDVLSTSNFAIYVVEKNGSFPSFGFLKEEALDT